MKIEAKSRKLTRCLPRGFLTICHLGEWEWLCLTASQGNFSPQQQQAVLVRLSLKTLSGNKKTCTASAASCSFHAAMDRRLGNTPAFSSWQRHDLARRMHVPKGLPAAILGEGGWGRGPVLAAYKFQGNNGLLYAVCCLSPKLFSVRNKPQNSHCK